MNIFSIYKYGKLIETSKTEMSYSKTHKNMTDKYGYEGTYLDYKKENKQ